MQSADEARLRLVAIQAEGDECQQRYRQHVEGLNKAELQIAELKSRQTGIDQAVAKLDEWQRGAAESFVPASAVAAWQTQSEKLAEERMQLGRRILNLKSVAGSNRMAALKLSLRIEELHRAQRNMEVLARGGNPASGWQGGVSFVSGR